MNRPTIRSTPASSGGRPATVTPKTTSSRSVSRPSSTAQVPCTNVFSVSPRLRAEACRRPVSSADSSTCRCSRHAGRPGGLAGWGQSCSTVHAGQVIAPHRERRDGVLSREPGQVVCIRTNPWQRGGVARAAIQRHQLVRDDRHRPSVQQDVVAGEHQQVPLRAQTHQGEPQQRPRGKHEPLDQVG